MIAVGMMSGTSADGVSVAAVRIGRPPKFLAYRTFPYPRKLRERILDARGLRTPELSALHGDLGRYFGACAKRFIGKGRVDVIGSHGQTVWHEPGRHTLQIGEAAHIRAATGIPTVCDFRPADIAAGGQGAPLVPVFDQLLFGVRNAATLNLGGIANVTVLSKPPRGFDTGPANCLIDEAMRIAYGKPCDRGGRTAATGRIDRALLARLDHPWLRRPPPKSTGRELFGREFLLERCGRDLKRRPADVIATLTLFTAKTVGDAIGRFVKKPLQEVIVSGGGMFNRTLMAQLEWTLWPAVPRPVTVYGIHPLAKEPAAFAVLAALALQRRLVDLRSVTGARMPAILGKILP